LEQEIYMSAINKIASFSISTSSVEPARGIVEIVTTNVTHLFELDEEMAHRLCADLDRFLTQVPPRNRVRYG
jgi:hypothetical protein